VVHSQGTVEPHCVIERSSAVGADLPHAGKPGGDIGHVGQNTGVQEWITGQRDCGTCPEAGGPDRIGVWLPWDTELDREEIVDWCPLLRVRRRGCARRGMLLVVALRGEG